MDKFEQVIAARVDNATADRLRQLAESQGRPLSNYLRRLLERHIASRRAP